MSKRAGDSAFDPTIITAYRIPLSIVAQWPAPNYTDPETRTWLVPFSIVLTAISMLLVGMRLYARCTNAAGSLAVDDALVVAALILGMGLTGTAVFGILFGGYDRHVWDVKPSIGVKGALSGWIAGFAFTWSTTLTKLSILFFHRRLMARSHNTRVVCAIHVAMVLVIVYGLTVSVFLCLACDPIDATWTSMGKFYGDGYTCLWRGVWDPFLAGMSMLSDIYAVLLPSFLVNKLHVSLKQKLMLVALFGCGILSVGSGIARTYWLARLSSEPKRDLTWTAYEYQIWSILECHLALICASAPALKVFFEVYVVAPINKATSRRATTGHLTVADNDIFLGNGTARSYAMARKGSVQALSPMRDLESSHGEEQVIMVSTRFSFSSHVS